MRSIYVLPLLFSCASSTPSIEVIEISHKIQRDCETSRDNEFYKLEQSRDILRLMQGMKNLSAAQKEMINITEIYSTHRESKLFLTSKEGQLQAMQIQKGIISVNQKSSIFRSDIYLGGIVDELAENGSVSFDQTPAQMRYASCVQRKIELLKIFLQVKSIEEDMENFMNRTRSFTTP